MNDPMYHNPIIMDRTFIISSREQNLAKINPECIVEEQSLEIETILRSLVRTPLGVPSIMNLYRKKYTIQVIVKEID